MGEKNGRKKFFFQKHTDFASKQRWKKIVSKSAKLRFLKTHIYCDQKMGGKKTREIIFFRNTHISQTKNDGNNRLEKVRNTFFYKYMNIVTKKRGKKKRDKFFSRNTSISQAKNDGKKSSGQSVKTRFL